MLKAIFADNKAPSVYFIMNHISRDDQEVGMAREVKSPQFSQTMGQYWIGETKPKQAFR